MDWTLEQLKSAQEVVEVVGQWYEAYADVPVDKEDEEYQLNREALDLAESHLVQAFRAYLKTLPDD